MTRIRRLAKEGGWIFGGQVMWVVASLVLVRVLTEYLDSTQYGQLALGLTVAGLVSQVVMGGVTNSVSRFYSIATERRDLIGYMHAIRCLLLYATLVAICVSLLLIIVLWWLDHSQWIALTAAVLVLSLLSAYNNALSCIQNAARQRAIVALYGSLDAWLKIGLALGVMFWMGNSSTAVVIGYICSSLLVVLLQLVSLRRIILIQKQEPTKEHKWIREMWIYALPFSTFGMFTWMQQASDRWALQTFSSVTEVGHYAVLFQLGYTPILLFTGLLESFLGPILYKRLGDATDHIRNSSVHYFSWWITQLALVVTLAGFLFTFFMHEWLFSFLVAPEYRGDSYFLPWVLLAGGLFAAGQTLSLKLMSEMRPSSLTVVKITTALIGVLCNVLGAAYAGMRGVVSALIIFSAVYFIWMTLIAKNTSVKNA